MGRTRIFAQSNQSTQLIYIFSFSLRLLFASVIFKLIPNFNASFGYFRV